MDAGELGRRGVELMLEGIEATLARFGVHMDRYARESATHESGRGARPRSSELRERGHIYEQEGATWLRTTGFGDDKDRVLVRSSGELTYFAADIPYHWTKHERGYDRSRSWCWAPTTTATRPGSSRHGRRWAATRPASRS